MKNTDATEAAWAELDKLIARETELELAYFTWDRTQVSNFRWTGTEAERAELDALRDQISNHPCIIAENEAIARAEARC